MIVSKLKWNDWVYPKIPLETFHLFMKVTAKTCFEPVPSHVHTPTSQKFGFVKIKNFRWLLLKLDMHGIVSEKKNMYKN